MIDFDVSSPQDQPERTGRRRARRAAAAMASFVMSFGALNAAGSSEMSLDAGKAPGPYAAFPYISDYSPEDPNLIPAKAVSGIEVSDDFGGVISTRGYNIVIDETKLAGTLSKREMAVITQTDVIDAWGTEYDSEETSQTSVVSSKLRHKTEIPGFLTDQQEDVWRKYRLAQAPFFGGISSAHDTEQGKLSTGKKDLDSGLEAHDTSAYVRFRVFRFEEDGSITTATDQAATISFANNVKCEDDQRVTLTTEVKLDPHEHDVVCRIFRDYGALLENGYRIALDSTAYSWEADDSQSRDSRSIQLTYPYDDGKEVEDDMARQVALHEILHAAYSTAGEQSQPFYAANQAYRRMQMVMDYKMPNIDSSLSVGQVEPVWGAITESTYIGPGSRNGHPWDNPTEMLSSTASVEAFYPDKFMDNFAKLSLAQQAAVYSTTVAVGDLIRHYGVSVDSIIPRYTELDEHMQKLMNR